MKLQLDFIFEKETKGAIRYQEVGTDGKPAFAPKVGTFYIRKSALSTSDIPKSLVITITDEKGLA